MNDIQKLHRVIDSLEEQSAQVAEFNGLLSAVNDARTEIEAAKSTLANLATEQGELVTKNSNRFEEFEGRLTSLNDLLGQIKDDQLKLRREVAALKFVTPDQFEQGRAAIDNCIANQFAELNSKLEAAAESQKRSINDLLGQIKDDQLKLRREVADLKFVTPDQFEQGRAAIDSCIAKQFAELNSKLETAAESQKRSISGLRTIVVLGILMLAGGIGFLTTNMVL